MIMCVLVIRSHVNILDIQGDYHEHMKMENMITRDEQNISEDFPCTYMAAL